MSASNPADAVREALDLEGLAASLEQMTECTYELEADYLPADCREVLTASANQLRRLAALAGAAPDVDAAELADWRAMFAAMMEQGLNKLDPTFKVAPLWPNSWCQDVAFTARVIHESTPHAPAKAREVTE